MNKIHDAFSHGKAFIAFLTAGDPNLKKTEEYILAMAEAGADLIEIGIPFSDPIAEGPVIQRADLRALAAGTTTDAIFAMVSSVREKTEIPLVFMTYLNPVFTYGYHRFFAKCQNCGMAGIIIPDLPFEEKEEVDRIARGYGVEVISLIAPTSDHRITRIAQQAKGFLYLVSSMGVTGMRSEIKTDISSMVQRIRQCSKLPVAVGFGINTPEQAGRIAQQADGIIVGSAIVKLIEEYAENAAEPLKNYVKSMKNAMIQ